MASECTDCVSVSDALAAAAGSDRALGPSELDHLATCLRCRAEQSRYRRLMEAMQSLREAPTSEDSRLESQILETLDVYGHRWARITNSGVAAAVGGIAAGAAATAGFIAARHRRAARLAS
ncbi:MAG: hypothetical protein F4Z00_15080 [Acidimicrobiaceae bacterium]|nr:hypothetical protein [Acidimicrobiaceae bacterium]MXY10834.1 hypothetical protein [Acidimicrobiaceae bacterium]MXZ66850.1 hypothetical protein [Acidimicrobiaceae bacterium]MYE55671.1 hypothetical protein [Acidimicrobiaceae bacterium]MYF32949.1 hypothetical protein [Acidimicrobiaceae bacterium]